MSRLASMLGLGKRADEAAPKGKEGGPATDPYRATPAGAEVTAPAIEHPPRLERGLGQREAVLVLTAEDPPPLNEFTTEHPPLSLGSDEAEPLPANFVPPSFPGSYASLKHGGAWGKQKTTPGTALVNPHQYIASPSTDDVRGGLGGTLPEGVKPGLLEGQWTPGEGRNWGGVTPDWKKVGSAAVGKGLGSERDPTSAPPHTPHPSADFEFPPASDPPAVSRHPFEHPPQGVAASELGALAQMGLQSEPRGMGVHGPRQMPQRDHLGGPYGMGETRHEEALTEPRGMDLNGPRVMGVNELRHEEPLSGPRGTGIRQRHEEPLSGPRDMGVKQPRHPEPLSGPRGIGMNEPRHEEPLSGPRGMDQQAFSGSHTPIPSSSAPKEEEGGVARVVVLPPADFPLDSTEAPLGGCHVINNVDNAEHTSSKRAPEFAENQLDSSHHCAGGSPRYVLGTAVEKLEAVTRRMLKGGDTLWRETFPGIPADETLHKWFACLLSTEAGAVPGVLHVSDRYLAFGSDSAMRTASEKNEMGHQRSYYKVLLPLADVRMMDSKEHATSERDRSLQVVMNGGEVFWFFGFVHYNHAAFATRHFWSLMKQSATRGGFGPSAAEQGMVPKAGTAGSA